MFIDFQNKPAAFSLMFASHQLGLGNHRLPLRRVKGSFVNQAEPQSHNVPPRVW